MKRPDNLVEATENHLMYSLGKSPNTSTLFDLRQALSMAVRDRVMAPWHKSIQEGHDSGKKHVYYLSMEFLIGRLLEDALVNLGLKDEADRAASHFGFTLDEIFENEPDAALGNGGLGRLAACFLDSLATIGCPAIGYGIRYENGMFRQEFENGVQIEKPEDWLSQSHPWEFPRPEFAHLVGFGGNVVVENNRAKWVPAVEVLATCYDTPVIGWQGKWANTLRLWEAQSVENIDFKEFNRGEFDLAAKDENIARTISRVLYPDDTTPAGKELRFKQEYFFTAASIADILRRFFDDHGDIRKLSDHVAIQLNDTHPAIASAELMRILMDDHGIDFDEAVEITRNTLAYTNHTLMPEALERWSTFIVGTTLPRHMQIIEQIDAWHLAQNPSRPEHVGIVKNHEVRMGDLAFIMAHTVNGVSALHSELVKNTVFYDLDKMHPNRVINQTNGITPRRWLANANPALSNLITKTIGEGWQDNLDRLNDLEPAIETEKFRAEFRDVKHANKVVLADWVNTTMGIEINPGALFDVQIKRIHEYKRQLLNILETIAHWHDIRNNPERDFVPRVKFFGGKAAPGYFVAKEIIHLINDVAKTINNDPETRGLLKVIYPPNYNVSMAEILIPAADLSEQISTAGTEASGTGNMKFALNGALTIGTLDGANVEIREQVGAENFFLFGMDTDEVDRKRQDHEHAKNAINNSSALKNVLNDIAQGVFSPEAPSRYHGLVDRAWHHDHYLVAADFEDYYRAQRDVDAAYLEQDKWSKMAALNTSRMGFFSSDRTILGYMTDIWNAESGLK